MASSYSDPLAAAIKLVENGQPAAARELLTELVSSDEDNELAWFYLSELVEDDEERRICLENVLTLNPAHKEAGRRLADLDSAVVMRAQPVSFQQESNYDDIWNDEQALLCGFCAAPITPEDKRCPRCRHNLLGWIYAYEQPSGNFYLFLTVLGGLAFLLLADAGLQMARPEWPGFIVHQFAAGGLVATLLLFVLWRYSWAHVASIIVLSYLLVSRLIAGVVLNVGGITIEWLVEKNVRLNNLLDWLFALAGVGQIALLVVGLLVAIALIPADFARQYYHHVAKVGKKGQDATGYYMTGRNYAQKGQWATAARYWEMAVALAPGMVGYHKALGEAFGRLGFTARSLDALHWALDHSQSPELRAEIRELIQQVENNEQIKNK
ncbi:MAG: hypothetical protein KDE59_32175 [Anaerolineales bacterium]|nr:hypothetical protein [Anaerolineales bacterium]